jgi:hypothetical protein
MGELLEADLQVYGGPVGVISKLARRNREIACWRWVRGILMVGLREC